MKRLLSLLLIIVLMLYLAFFPAMADTIETDGITVYFNATKHGEFLMSHRSETLKMASVSLIGSENYTLDDAFKALHDTYYVGGSTAGYVTARGDLGLSVTKFWGMKAGCLAIR